MIPLRSICPYCGRSVPLTRRNRIGKHLLPKRLQWLADVFRNPICPWWGGKP